MKQLLVISLTILLVVCSAIAESDALVKFESHNIRVTLDVPNHSAELIDEGLMQLDGGWNIFQINKTAIIDSFAIKNELPAYMTYSPEDIVEIRKGWFRFKLIGKKHRLSFSGVEKIEKLFHLISECKKQHKE